MDFAMTVAVAPPTVRLTALGELDIFGARLVARELRTALTAGCRDAVVDVAGVTFVDGSALGVFARAYGALSAERASLEFVETSASFRRMCALTHLDAVFGLN